MIVERLRGTPARVLDRMRYQPASLLTRREGDAWSAQETNVWRGFSTVDVEVEADAPIATASYRRASRLDLVA